jgi:hypothetical protein
MILIDSSLSLSGQMLCRFFVGQWVVLRNAFSVLISISNAHFRSAKIDYSACVQGIGARAGIEPVFRMDG